MAAVAFRGVDIVFGRRPERALPLLDAGRSRDEIRAATGAVVGVAGVDLAIQPGETFVLMGLSGSGKSTLLRAVNRLTDVTRGAVLVQHDGQEVDVARCDAATLRAIRAGTVSMVFQGFGLLPWRTVRHNVGLGPELQGRPAAERARIVDEKLALVGLSSWADRPVGELSGGMQQRVGLARALATDADILLMDEPFSALDPLIRARLQDELLAVQRALRKTILFVTHDLAEALRLGDRIAVMQDGRIVQTGTAEDILLRPASAYVAAFVEHVNPLDVLRGGAFMRPAAALARAGDAVLLDGESRLRLRLDREGRPLSVTIDGVDGVLGTGKGAACDVVVAPVALTLREAIGLKRGTGAPLLLVDGDGRLAGVCGDAEIYAGLLRGAG